MKKKSINSFTLCNTLMFVKYMFCLNCFRIPYHCARSSKWGDRLPIIIKEEDKSE